MTSQRVAPSAVAPSCTSRGTVRKRSRLIEAMIGRIMIVRIRPAVNMLLPVVCAGPTSLWSSIVASTMRSRVRRWLSARAFSSYLRRISVDMVFSDVTLPARWLNIMFIERRLR